MIKTSLTPPTIDQATIDHYVAKGRREHALAFWAMLRSLFRAPEALTESTSAMGKRAGRTA